MSQSHLVSVFLDVILSNNGYSFSVLPLRLTWARLYWTWSFSKAAADSGSTICSPAFVWQAQESMNSLTVYIFLKVCSTVFWLLLPLLVALTFLKSTFPVTTSEMLPHSMKLPPLMVCLLSSKWSTLNYNGKVFFRLHHIKIFNVVFCCLCPGYKYACSRWLATYRHIRAPILWAASLSLKSRGWKAAAEKKKLSTSYQTPRKLFTSFFLFWR